MIKANQALEHGDSLDASRYLARVGEYFPWRFDLTLKAGRLAMEAGDPKLAILYFERPGVVSHLTGSDVILLGDAYDQSNDQWTAEAIWKHAADEGNSIQANERLANLYLLRKDYESAATRLQNMMAMNPAEISLYYQIGSLYAATDPQRALPYLAQAAEIDSARAAKARILHDRIRTAGIFGDPAYTFLISGRQLANSGEWELAAEAFHRATLLKPDYADAWAFLGEARGQVAVKEAGSVSAAGLYELNHALQLDAGSTLANTFMGLYWERREDYTQAQIYIRRAISLNPDDPFLLSELGNIQSKAGDLPAAQSAYQAAIQLSPKDPLFYSLLAEFALQNHIQIRELALIAARQAITLDPEGAYSLDVMAQVLLALQDYHSAERFLQKAIQSDPEFSPAYLHLGSAYLYLAKPDLARQWLKLAETINPGSWVALQANRMLNYYFP